MHTLQEIRSRVLLGVEVQPTICFYTFLNAHNALTSACVSPDCTNLVSGFDDSSVGLWKLRSDGTNDGRAFTKCKRLLGHSVRYLVCLFLMQGVAIVSCVRASPTPRPRPPLPPGFINITAQGAAPALHACTAPAHTRNVRSEQDCELMH